MKRFMTFLVAAFLGLSSQGNAASDKPKPGGTLRMAIQKDISVLNPLVSTKSTEQAIRELMFEPLLAIDLQGNLQPLLAESWEASRDGKVYTFQLRRGVKFHNGEEMTAEDVKFALDYSMNPKNGATGMKALRLVDHAVVQDRYGIRIFMKKGSPAFLYLLASIKTFSVVPKGSLEEGVYQITKFPPGTGPFKFLEWQPKQQIILDRFDGYWGQKPFVDQVALRPIRDETVRFTALRSHDVDIVERTPYEWVKQVTDGKIAGITAVRARHAGFRRLMFNAYDPPFNNRKLRLAVAHAINKKEILNAAYFGFGEPSDQKYPQGHSWHFDIPAPSHDLAKARALLKEAGYAGEMIKLQSDNSRGDQAEAATLQAQLKKIGMNVEIEALERNALSSRQRKGDFNFAFSGASFDPDPSQMYGGLKCGDPRKRTANSSGYCNKELDALLARGESEMDSEQRREIYKQVVGRVLTDIPELYIGFVPRFFTLRDTVKGFTTDGEGSFRWWGGGLNITWLAD